MAEKKCVQVRYRGHVQGVGFRFTVDRIAGQFDLGGFVRNESDGSVLLVAEGPKESVDSFIDEIESSELGGYINDKSVSEEPADGSHSNSFRIEY